MFSLEEVIFFHDKAIETYGGAKGIRDFGLLDAALHRPWQLLAEKICIQHVLKKLLRLLKASFKITLSLMGIKGQVLYYVKPLLKKVATQLVKTQI